MQWLPAVQYESAGWLLPLAPTTAHFLSGLICDHSDQQGPLADPEWAAMMMAQRLERDPSLAIFSMLELVSRHPETAGKGFAIETHSNWFCETIVDLFRDRDRQLSTHQRATELEQKRSNRCGGDKWKRLAKSTLNLPIECWLRSASDWLCETGPMPSESWQASWPRFLPTEEIRNLDSPGRESNESAGEEKSCDSAEWLEYGLPSIDLYRLARNQTELRQLRERFATRLEIEKLASLKQLAYGLSHEINNPLAAIRTRAEQLKTDERQFERREKLGRIVDSAMRAHEMIADMMYFAKPPKPELESASAVSLTKQIVAEFEADASSRKISVVCEIQQAEAGAAFRFCGDPGQIGDALRALIRNSMEAIGHRGSIAVEVKRSGQRIIWTVLDNGPGLSEEARRHAFDPYFSGREAGRGLGLGLCRVYRIARAHGGGAIIEGAPVGCRVRMWVQAKP